MKRKVGYGEDNGGEEVEARTQEFKKLCLANNAASGSHASNSAMEG